MRRIRVVLALVFASTRVASAQVPPDADWRTLETEHFRVTYPPGLEALAGHAASRAETVHARLSAALASAPRGTIDILLTDHVDLSNGAATPFPSNRIVLFARPPVDVPSLAYFEDWIDLVVTHELTHVFHLDATGTLGSMLRTVFGRLPFSWPVFPAVGTPSWAIEGLATYIESEYTGEGRVHGSYHDMVLRTAVLEGAFDPIDRVTGGGATWPGGSRAYIYGSLFSAYLSRVYGPEVQKELVSRTARAWVPPVLAFDRVAKKATGRSFTDAYRDWRAEREATYGRLADSLRAEGLTEVERLADAGYAAEHPRAAADGRVAFAAYDGRGASATRILDPATGRVHDLARRNGLDALAWLPDASILTAQLERDGPYRLFGDLYRVGPDGRERRLTEGARLTAPDAARDGRRVVAVQAAGGTNRLVVHDLGTGATRPLTTAEPDVHWASPRWAPSGDRIAAARWRRGEYDVVVLDAAGGVTRELTRDRAVDAAPAWSPDGRYVLFSSDRSGIPNLYAYDLADGVEESARLRQVTNLLTGAFDPDVSPDGRWIYFAGYHADGYHIERVPFDPAGWREPAPLRPALLVAGREAPAAGPAAAPLAGKAGDGLGRRDRPYSALPTLLPRAWLPEVFDEGGTFVGAAAWGQDLVGRHAFRASAAYQRRHGLFEGGLSYAWRGLGNPVLGLESWRQWEEISIAPPADAPGATLMSREDGIALLATLLRSRVRSSAFLSVGVDGVVDRRRLFEAPGYAPGYPGTTRVGTFVQAGYANYQLHPFSISREDGVSIAVGALRRRDLDPFAAAPDVRIDRSYDELRLTGAGYGAFAGPGFANHVLAARAAGRARTGPGAETFGIGGASGGSIEVLGRVLAGSRRAMPVRGFHGDARLGTRGWTGSLEYRVPVALIERGYRLWPIFLDRVSAAAFLDAGDAWCTPEQRATLPVCDDAAAPPIAGAGAEVALDLTLFFGARTLLRAGVGIPVRGGGPQREPVAYLQLGPAF